jgi:Predicted nucleoside-diphosphate sugar epimerases
MLFILLPAFLIYSAFVFTFTGMFKSKWRFTSLPDLMTILRAASVQAITLLVLDYVLLAPNVYGTFFFGKITIVLYWFLQMFFLAGTRIAYRYFRYTRTLSHTKADGALPTLVLGNAADAEVLLRAMESGAVTRIRPIGILSPSRADRGQAIRGVAVLGDLDDLESVVADLGRARDQHHPHRTHPDRAGARSAAGRRPDACSAARPCDQPAAGTRSGRRSVAIGASQCRRPAAAAEREDRLSAA